MLFVSLIYGAFYEMEGSAGLVLITFVLIQVCSILGAWIMYRLVEKPSLALTKKIRYRA